MGLPEDDTDVQTVYLATYKKFMEAIDAIDNGEFCGSCCLSALATHILLLGLSLSQSSPGEAEHQHVLFSYMFLTYIELHCRRVVLHNSEQQARQPG